MFLLTHFSSKHIRATTKLLFLLLIAVVALYAVAPMSPRPTQVSVALETADFAEAVPLPDKSAWSEPDTELTPTLLPVGTDRANAATDPTITSAPTKILPAAQLAPITTSWTEEFDDIALLPGRGWAMINNSSPLGSNSWFQGNSNVFTAHQGADEAYIAANFMSTADVGTISNWLLTPEMAVNNGDSLSFWTRSIGSNWPDRLEVRWSSSGSSTNVGATATSVGDFNTLLLSINPALTGDGYPQTWTRYVVEISGLSGPVNGRIAFRYFVTNGGPSGSNSDYIGIDTVTFSRAPHKNGPFINQFGTGHNGRDESVAQNNSLGMGVWGFSNHAAIGARLADEFTVTDTAWQLDRVHLFAYQTNSSTTSPITAVNLRIWDGPPGTPGATVIFGDTNTNRLRTTYWTGTYRVNEDTSGDTSRPIMKVVANVGVTLQAGTYWLDWQLDGSNSLSGPWAVPITLSGQDATGKARQFISGSWLTSVSDGFANVPQGFPFVLVGQALTPGHDLFASVRTIHTLPYLDVDNTLQATRSNNDPVFPCGSGNQGHRSVWYRYTPSTTGRITAYTYDSDYDTMLAVWTGSSPANLTNVACNDDAGNPTYGLQSQVSFQARAGTTYYIQVTAYGSHGQGGKLIFNLQQSDQWSFSGPQRPSPSINEITIVPQSPNTVLAATTEGVFKSTNGGSSWVAKRNGLSTFGGLEVTNIVVDPTNSQNVYLSAWGDGVYRSTDGGENWSRMSNPLEELTLHHGELSAPDEERIIVGGPAFLPTYLAQASPDTMDEPVPGGAETADGLPLKPALSDNDPTLFSPNPINWVPARTLAIHPTNNNRLIVAVAGNGFYITQNATNPTISWSPLSMPEATLSSGRTIAFSPSNPNIAYASFGDFGDNGGIFRSDDGGLNWSLVAGNDDIDFVVMRFAIDPANPNRVFAATYGNGIMVTTNGGGSWFPTDNGLGSSSFLNIEISPANPNIIYANSYWHIWKSLDNGSSWQLADSNYAYALNYALALHPTDSNIAYVGSYQTLFTFEYISGGIQKTVDGGQTFTPQLNGLSDTYVLDVVVDPNDPNIIYAATWGSGIFRSIDGGVTWHQANAGLWLPFVYTLEAVSGPMGTVLYAGTFYSNAALFVSYNQGVGWTALPVGTLPPFARTIFDIASSDGSPQNLVIATGDGIHTTFNGGQTWQRSLIGGQDTRNIMLSLTRVEGIAGRMVAGTFGDGIYYSNNQGYDWTKATGVSAAFVYGLSSSPGSSTEVYAAHAAQSTGGQAIQGLSRSTNGGTSWNIVTSGLPVGVSFRSVSHNPVNNGHVYGGSIGQGMWVRPSGSDRWFPFSNGFTPTQVRTVQADVSHPMRVFASTDGQGVWSFMPDRRPTFEQIYLPITLR